MVPLTPEGWKSGALRWEIVNDVEKTAGFQWMGMCLTARASSDTFRIREKGGLKFLYPLDPTRWGSLGSPGVISNNKGEVYEFNLA